MGRCQGYEMGRSRVRGWHLDVEVVALALWAAVRDHYCHRARLRVLVAAPLHTRMLPMLIACMSNRILTEHLQLLETGRKHRNIDAQTDGYPGLYCTQCAGKPLWHQSQQAQSICLTANWPPLCWHSTSKHSLRETAQVRALARHTAVSSDIPQA